MILFYWKWRVSDGVRHLAESIGIEVDVRDDADADLDPGKYDAVIPTPWVSPKNRVYSSDRILAEMDFAARYLPQGFKTICVTGTDGKSTTAWILYKLLCAEYGSDKVFLSGNFEIPFSETVREIRERGLKRGFVVIEVSSFMAHNLSRESGLKALNSLPKGEREGGFHPDYSIFTNFETDHLNWHRDLQEYLDAKMRVFELTTRLSAINAQVFARAQEMGLGIPRLGNVRVFWSSGWQNEKMTKWEDDNKNRHREHSVAILGGESPSKIAASLRSSQWRGISDRIEYPHIIISGRKKYSMDETQFSGVHNAMNILSVALVTSAMKICSKRTREYLKNISGLAHRLEFVTDKKWVRFVDDSKSTSAQSLIAALGSFRKSTPTIPSCGGGVSSSPGQGELEGVNQDEYWQVGENERFSPWEGGARGGFLSYDTTLVMHARENRKNMSEPEKCMWQILRNKQFSAYKFQRQKPIGKYIVDFYCPDLHLVLEIDGDSHVKIRNHDRIRTQFLNQQGLNVLRYTNREVMYNIEGVYEDLMKWIERLQGKPTPTLPSQGGGNILLIAWGSDKWDEFVGVGEAMWWVVRHVELIGATREKLAEICKKHGIDYHLADSMDEAVRANFARAESGDTILLSPGCASFGMFRDYLDRAEKFRETIDSL